MAVPGEISWPPTGRTRCPLTIRLLFRFVVVAYERLALGIASNWTFNNWGRFPTSEVELRGIEPLTSSMPWKRSTN